MGRSATLLVLAKLVGYAFPLVTLPMLTRPLGPGPYGEVVYANSFVTLLYLVTEYGMQVTATRDVAMARRDALETSAIFWRTIALRLGLCVVAYGILVAVSLAQGFGRDRFANLSIAFLLTLGEAINPTWFFMGMESTTGLVVTTLVARLLTVPLIAVLVNGPGDVKIAIFLVAFPWLAGGVMAHAWALREGVIFVRPRWRELLALARRGASAAFASAAANANQSIAVVVLGSVVLGPAVSGTAVGLFGTAITLIAASKQVLMPVGQLAYSRTSYLDRHDPAQVAVARRKAVQLLVAGALVVTGGLFVAAPLVTRILFGAAYAGSIGLIRIMCLVPVLFMMGQAMSTQYLFATGRGRIVVLATVLGNVTCVVSATVLGSRYGAPGTAWAFLVSEAVAAAAIAWAASRPAPAVMSRASGEPESAA